MPGAANLAVARTGFKAFVRTVRDAYPDVRFEFDDLFGNGDRVATRVTIRGTNRGSYGGRPATGQTLTWTGIGITRYRDGRIAEQWANTDAIGSPDIGGTSGS